MKGISINNKHNENVVLVVVKGHATLPLEAVLK